MQCLMEQRLLDPQRIINTDDNSGVILENIFIKNIPAGAQVNESALDNVDFINVVLDVNPDSLANYFEAATIPSGITAGSAGAKADASVFDWTYAGQAGELTDL